MTAERRAHDFDSELSLAELVNRVLDRGAVVQGDVVISVAGVDLLHLGLQVMITAVETELAAQSGVARAITDARIRAAMER